MEHTIRNESGVTIVDLSGEIDVGLATTLRDTLINLVESQPGPLLINLSDVRYIDSAGLSILIAANRKSKKAGGDFGLSNPQIAVQQIFKLTRVDKVLKIFPTVEEGIAKLRNGA
jgi:anti-sigma B factor antagonist